VVHDNEDYFWPTIFKEIEENYNTLSSTDSQDTAVNLNASVNINFYFELFDFFSSVNFSKKKNRW